MKLPMNLISDYLKVFKAEWLKLRNSGMFWLVLIMAACIPVLFTLLGLLIDDNEFISVNTENAWKVMIGNCFKGFGSFFYPIFLTLLIVRLTQMEHRGGGWKLIETQPVSKQSLYLGKFSISILIALLCIIALVLFALLGGFIIMFAKETSGYARFYIPVDFIVNLAIRTLISGLGILAIQYLFSVIISGFIGPFAIGLGSTITGTILVGFGKVMWWPYTLPWLTVINADGSQTGKFLMHYEWLSIAWMFIGLWLGYQWYEKKTIKRAFLKPAGRLVHLFAPVVLFTAFFIYVNKPAILPSHSRTVITGKLEMKEKVSKAYLIAEPLFDTILEIPVENNNFHFHTTKPIPAGMYYFKAGALASEQIFFSSNDSLFIQIKTDGKSRQSMISGTRFAENKFMKDRNISSNYDYEYIRNFGYELKPAVYVRKVISFWKNEINNLTDYKTADNLKLHEDFIVLHQKMIAMKYLNMLDFQYAKWYRIYHPNEKLEFPKSVHSLRADANYNDSNLLGFENYRDYISEYYEQHYKLSRSNDTAYLSKLCSVLPSGNVRDFLVYSKLKEAISRTMDSIKRESLLKIFLPKITKTGLHTLLEKQHALLKSLNRGKEAPNFISTALNKDTISLQNFKGRYVVIDIWATWCGPCKVQSPSFERIAEQYNSPSVLFVSLSVDDNKWAWQNEASEKSFNVIQLLINDIDEFSRIYGIEYIPRFMLLGPDGKIINAMMPQPTDQMFEEILKQEIPGLKSL